MNHIVAIQFLSIRFGSKTYPSQLHFEINFFDFPLTKTNTITIERNDPNTDIYLLISQKSTQGDTDSREYV